MNVYAIHNYILYGVYTSVKYTAYSYLGKARQGKGRGGVGSYHVRGGEEVSRPLWEVRWRNGVTFQGKERLCCWPTKAVFFWRSLYSLWCPYNSKRLEHNSWCLWLIRRAAQKNPIRGVNIRYTLYCHRDLPLYCFSYTLHTTWLTWIKRRTGFLFEFKTRFYMLIRIRILNIFMAIWIWKLEEKSEAFEGIRYL